MQLTKNFKKSEFESKDGSPMPLDVLPNVVFMAQQLQKVRDYINKPIIINSAYRSPKHNAKVGGAKNSYHLYGKAVDIRVLGCSSLEIYTILENLIDSKIIPNGGIILYNSFVHYDVRKVPYRKNVSKFNININKQEKKK